MIRIIIIVISLFFCIISYSYKLSETKYIIHKDSTIDTVRITNFIVTNTFKEPAVILFTEDNIQAIGFDKALRRRCFKRYGDLSLASWSYDNIETVSDSVYCVFPDTFVKILYPQESFCLSVISSNTMVSDIKKCINKHMLICRESDIEQHITRFVKSTMDIQYKSDVFLIEWSNLYHSLNNNNEDTSDKLPKICDNN